MARNCCAQNLTDHWPVLTHIRLPEKKKAVAKQQKFGLERREGAKTESDECGTGRVIVESSEAAEDTIGEVSIENITECIPNECGFGRVIVESSEAAEDIFWRGQH